MMPNTAVNDLKLPPAASVSLEACPIPVTTPAVHLRAGPEVLE